MSENNNQDEDQDANEAAHSLLLRVPQDIAHAFALLTRIPIPAFLFKAHGSIARATWAFPLAGAAIGIIAALTYTTALILGLDIPVAVVVAMMVAVITSGALHEDGLADFADGIGGGQSKKQRLEIMRDSRIGTFGMLALGFTVVLQGLLLISLARPPQPWQMTGIFLSVSVVSRTSILIPMALLSTARPDGLGARAARVPKTILALGLIIGITATAFALGPIGALLAISGALVATAIVCLTANHFLGGQTGDVLGATASLSTLGALAALTIGAAVLSPASGALP